MKKILLFCLFSFAVSAQTVSVKLKIHIENPNSDSLEVSNADKSFRKVLRSKGGSFDFKLDLAPGIYYLDDGKQWTALYFKEGFDLSVTVDAQQFEQTLKFTGKGEMQNNFLASNVIFDERYNISLGKFQVSEDYAGYQKMRMNFVAESEAKIKSVPLEADLVSYVNGCKKKYSSFMISFMIL